MLNKQLVNYNNKLYWVYRKIKENHIKINKLNDIKELWSCDIVVRQKNGDSDDLIFLKEIPDVEYAV
jgi:hypothetical protein